METLLNFLKNMELVISSYPILIQVFIWGFLINILFILFISAGSFTYFKSRKKIRKRKVLKSSDHSKKERVTSFLISLLNSKISYTRSEIYRLLKTNLKDCKREDHPFYTIAFVNIITLKTDLRKSHNYHAIISSLLNFEKNDYYLADYPLTTLFKPEGYSSIVNHSNSALETATEYPETETDAKTSKHTKSKKPDEILNLFDLNPHDSLNKWEQMIAFNQLIKIKRKDLPEFEKLLNPARDPSQLRLLCQLITYFKDYSAVKQLQYLLIKSRDESLKKEIIKTFGELSLKGIESNLFKIFPVQNEVCKIEIIKSISKFPSDKVMQFLTKIYKETPNSDFRIVIAKAIHNLNAAGQKFITERTRGTLDKLELQILLHVQNELINNEPFQKIKPHKFIPKTVFNDLTKQVESN